MMLREPTRSIDDPIKPSGDSQRVAAKVWVGTPVEMVPLTDEGSEDFTEDVFEDALDKSSCPVKGKYAHIPYSSEDFIRDKREEVALEERES